MTTPLDIRTDPAPALAPVEERPPPGQRVLRRTRERKVAGVCGGLARYLGLDPVIVRVAFVLLAVFGGSGILLYLICAVVIPEEQPGESIGPEGTRSSGAVAVTLGVLLVAIGFVALVTQVVPGFTDFLGPALLVTAGALVLVIGARR